MKPKRGSVRAIFSVEDDARMPGLEDALVRDLRGALMDGIDKASSGETWDRVRRPTISLGFRRPGSMSSP